MRNVALLAIAFVAFSAIGYQIAGMFGAVLGFVIAAMLPYLFILVVRGREAFIAEAFHSDREN